MTDHERTVEVLAARARILARPLESSEHADASIQMLGFEAGGDRFALPVESVVTVIAGARPTPLPGMPSWLSGAVDVRGRVVAVVNPDQFLGTQDRLERGVERDLDRATAVVIAQGSGEIALLVERLDPVVSIGPSAILPCPAGSSDRVAQVARGMVDGRLFLEPDGFIAAIRAQLAPVTDSPAQMTGRRSLAQNK